MPCPGQKHFLEWPIFAIDLRYLYTTILTLQYSGRCSPMECMLDRISDSDRNQNIDHDRMTHDSRENQLNSRIGAVTTLAECEITVKKLCEKWLYRVVKVLQLFHSKTRNGAERAFDLKIFRENRWSACALFQRVKNTLVFLGENRNSKIWPLKKQSFVIES